MKRLLIVTILFTCLLDNITAQAILDRLKDKVRNRIDQRTDEGMEKGIDKVEDGVKNKKKTKKDSKTEKDPEKNTTSTIKSASGAGTSFQAYSRYDFVPGNNILFAEDFSQDVIGEFPLKWATNNRAEVVRTDGQKESKWLRMHQGGHFVSPLVKKVPENFTAEFDLILQFDGRGDSYVYPHLQIKFISTAQNDAMAKQYLLYDEAVADIILTISPGDDGSSTINLRSLSKGTTYFDSEEKGFKKLNSYFGKPMHFAFSIQKGRYRCWINGEKLYDIPQAVPEKAPVNHIDFVLGTSAYQDEQLGYYVSNLVIAEGIPDMRSKLLTEGKLSTNGILFDSNSDKIKPESAGTLNEIAAVLKENAGLKVKIVGHTDNEGEDNKNLELSKRRAASVKEALSKSFGIDASRLETDGLGESKPVADNNTKEGKAQNRRVEFIKL